MPIKALLLDFYGTLVRDNAPEIKEICRKISATSRRLAPSSPADVGQRWSQIMRDSTQVYQNENFRTIRDLESSALRQLVQEFECAENPLDLSAELFASLTQPSVFPDTLFFLMRVPLPVCIIANADNSDLKDAMDYARIDVELIATSQDCLHYKPHPAIFLHAADTLNIKPQEILMVGDSLTFDIEPAMRQGMRSAWINRYQHMRHNVQPDLTFSSLNDLAAIIK